MKRHVFCNEITAGINLVELNQFLICKHHLGGGKGGLSDGASLMCLLEVALKAN